MENNKKVLVIGGTGFFGYYVIRALSEAGFKLGVLVHKRKDDFNIPYDGYTTFEGDVLKPETLDNVIEEFKPDVIAHLVGIMREKHPDLTYKKIHIQGTQNVVEAAKKAGVKKIIYVSTLGADPNGSTEYYKSKAQAEVIVINSGLGYTIFRPAIMFGWRSQSTNRLKRYSKFLPFIPVVANYDFKIQPVAAETVADLISQAAGGKGDGNIYPIVGPEALTVYEVTERMREKMHSIKPILAIPVFVANIAASLGALGLPTPVTKPELKMLLEGEKGNNEAAKKDFEVKEIYFDAMGEYPLY